MKHNKYLPFLFVCMFVTNLQAQDKYLWLENIDDEKSMQWVTKHNKITDNKLASTALYKDLYSQALTVLNTKNKLPSISQNGKWIYNLWQDSQNPRGIYRRTTLKQFKKDQPKWQTILDMDKYSQQQGQNYDFRGLSCALDKQKKCLIRLSPGGSDAVEIREFNIKKKQFVKNGIFIPLAKTRVSWKDKHTLYIGTDFGEGSLTESGYPRIVKQWDIKTPLKDAQTIYTADKKSTSATAYSFKDKNSQIDLISDSISIWASDKYQLTDGKITALTIPASASILGLYQERLVISLKKDWQFNQQEFIAGEVVLVEISLLRGEPGQIESVIKPDAKTVIEKVNTTKHGLLITILEDVKAKLYRYQKHKDGNWKIQTIAFPENGALNVSSVDDKSGDFFVQYESFITPPGLYYIDSKTLTPQLVKQQNESFDGSRFKVEQYFTNSNDGTRVPYFVVMNKNTQLNSKNPTHIFSYGGFRSALTPSYSGSYEKLFGAYGKLWLERGGVFVLANIRGGGEYGPTWHQAALLKNKHKSFEDFEAVAKDLFARKITSAKHLGIEGRSNGGLLVTATMIRHPELYAAVISGVPLVDMQRYNKLLAGASWMGEYGNPDKAEMWDYIKTYSPYQNIKPGVNYPPIFFYTSTRDDRVHPGHARKMAAKMLEYGNQVDYYENIEGGHSGFSTNEQLAHRLALSYTHLWNNLK
ncbi:Prolyl endopeptidase [hydrothermal vent metagenome]|uniref:Prolyl endopeptidase n=1 Tax=hydrothermal vent metagenome TaxID=652676 RepID=A0A3B0V477_9ZZZZ